MLRFSAVLARRVAACSFGIAFFAIGWLPASSAISDDQVDQLLERYERGVLEDRFRFFPGKSLQDVERLLRSGELKGIRREVLYPTEIGSGELAAAPAEEGSGWGDGAFAEETAWGADGDSAWVDDSAPLPAGNVIITTLLQQISMATQNCEYGKIRELADSILKVDEGNEWVLEHYDEIVLWEEKAQAYTAALQEAYRAIESDDFETMVGHLKTAYANAARKCGQDEVVQQLIDQAAESSRLERDAAIAQARQEGAIHQQTFAEREAQQNADRERRQNSRSGMARGLMGLLSTATQVAAMTQGGVSTSDALQQTLQQQVLSSNPQLAQTLGQVQQIQGMVQNGNAGSFPMSTGSGNQSLPGLGAGGAASGGATTSSNAASPQMSAACRALFEKVQQIGYKMKPLAEQYSSFIGNNNVSQAEIQRVAAQIQIMAREQMQLVNQLKANGCPGTEQIPTYSF